MLCEHVDERPGHLDPLRSRYELRFTDVAGLPDAIADAQVLLLWDFFSSALEQVGTDAPTSSGSTSLPRASTRCSSQGWSPPTL